MHSFVLPQVNAPLDVMCPSLHILLIWATDQNPYNERKGLVHLLLWDTAYLEGEDLLSTSQNTVPILSLLY